MQMPAALPRRLGKLSRMSRLPPPNRWVWLAAVALLALFHDGVAADGTREIAGAIRVGAVKGAVFVLVAGNIAVLGGITGGIIEHTAVGTFHRAELRARRAAQIGAVALLGD